jgi:hypothetical protein
MKKRRRRDQQAAAKLLSVPTKEEQLCIRQEELGAPRKIYGDFNLRLIEIDKLIVALGAPLPE